MSKQLFKTVLLSFFLCAFFSLSAQATETVPINEQKFPDQNFRKYVQKFDTNQDGILDQDELNAVTEIDVAQLWVFDITGIEFFPNLKTLLCNQNRIHNMNLSQNKKLVKLVAWLADIYTLDVSQNTELEVLALSSNSIVSLDLSNNKKLKTIDLSSNARVFYDDKVFINSIDGFEMSRASQWENASIKGSIITVIDFNKPITYIYDMGNGHKAQFTWLFRESQVQEPTLTQTITATPSYTKYYGDPSFKIFASTTGDGKLDFTSSKNFVATINDNGEVQINNAGTTTITITASKTNMYLPAWKTVEVTILPKESGITDLNPAYTFTYGDGNHQLPMKANGGSIQCTSSNNNVVKTTSSGNLQFTGAGKAIIHVVLTPSPNYKGTSQDVIVTVLPKPLTISNVKSTYTFTDGKKSLTLKPQSNGKLTYTVKDKKVVTINNNGKVTVKGPGKTIVIITTSGNQNFVSTSKTITITVKPKTLPKPKVSSKANKKITIQWKKDSKVSGYEIWYATNAKFTKNKKVVTIKKSNTTKKIVNTKKKSTYYIKVRSYRLVGKSKLYSSFTKTANIIIK